MWCRAACAAGIFTYDDAKGFVFAPFMDELLADESPDLPTTHIVASLTRDYLAYPEMFRSGKTKSFADHESDFFAIQGRISALRAPQIVAVARQLPSIEDRLRSGEGWTGLSAGAEREKEHGYAYQPPG